MSEQLFTLPRVIVFDTNAALVSGAKANFYIAGTLTRQNTFTDSALTTPHANPVIADGNGVFAPIYLDATLNYKVDITDSLDSSLADYPVDNITAALTSTEVGTALYPTTTGETSAGVTPTNFQYEPGNVLRYGAVGDGVADDTTAIQAALDSGESSAFLPKGTYKTTSPLVMPIRVSLVGEGMLQSILAPNSCDGISYNHTAGFGNPTLANFSIEGTNTSTNTAIQQTSTLDQAVQIHGIQIDGVSVRAFNVAAEFFSVFELSIRNCWFQDINSGIRLLGQCFSVGISNNSIIKAAGSGTGDSNCIFMDEFDFTDGVGLLKPEGVRFTGVNHYHGFDYGFRIDGALSLTLDSVDVQAKIEGIHFEDVPSVLNIINSYIEINGTSASVAIRGTDLAAATDSKINIINNRLIAANSQPASATGIFLGLTSGTGNQDNVTIANNDFRNFKLYDIATFNSGHIQIYNNFCNSADVTASIFIEDVPSGRIVYVEGNDCLKVITTTAADRESGDVVLGTNIVSGTTVDHGTKGGWYTPTFSAGDFTANGSMTWTVASGDVTTYAYNIRGNVMTLSFTIATTTVGGSLNTQLRIAVPASKTITKRMVSMVRLNDSGTVVAAWVDAGAGDTFVSIQRLDAAAFTAATNTTYVYGQITFEID